MQEFVDTALSFPTVVFTVGLLLMVVFWLFAGFGAIDTEGVPSGGGGGGPISAILSALGITTVPATLLLTFFFLFGWLVSLGGARWVVETGPSTSAWLLLAAACALAIPPTVVISRPFGRVFMHNPAQKRDVFVGRVCQIRTGSISERFGQGEVLDDEGASLLVEVRCEPGNDLRSGDWAIIHTYDPDAEVFWVSRADESIIPH
ncbi:MAG: DUF1449 family protein [Acidimicrobiia bacterium]|nr:DUF1449 family protein [Acidimicrobiia bacterium]